MKHQPATAHEAEAAEPTETFEMAVEGDRPVQHAHRIESLLKNARGIQKVEAHEREERVLISYDPRVTDPAAIHEFLLEHGYKPAPRAD
jgi:hypothetical protein